MSGCSSRITVAVTRFIFICGIGLQASFAAETMAAANAAAPAPAVNAGIALGGEALAAPLHLSAAELAAMPRQHVSATEHGNTAAWDGVALTDLLQRAGVPAGEAIRGKALALYVRVSAADGYRAVYSLAELDPLLGGAQVILADHRDGQPLDAKDGPLRMIVPGDKRPARWVRQVTAIDVLRAP